MVRVQKKVISVNSKATKNQGYKKSIDKYQMVMMM